jgi:hypothetical protein
LLRAEPPIRIYTTAGAVKIDNCIETMLFSLEPISFNRLNLHLVNAGPQSIISRPAYDVIPLADHDFRFAFSIAVEADAQPPTPDSLSLDQRVRRDVEALNPQAVASATSPATIRADAV